MRSKIDEYLSLLLFKISRKPAFTFQFFLMTLIVHSQCPTITCPSIFTLTSCQRGSTLSATSNYSANITSRWIGPGNIPIASAGTATSDVYVNYAGAYKVAFTDNSSNCTVVDTVQVVDVFQKPSFNLDASSFTLCNFSIINVNCFASATFPLGGPLTYTVICPVCSTVIPTGTLSSIASYAIGTCGDYEIVARDNINLCDASFKFTISCSTLTPIPLIVTGNNTVCSGSSVTYTSNGINNHWGFSSISSSTINFIPLVNSTITAYGNDINNCPSTGTIAVTVNTTCSDVWPGDANSDGFVNNQDVFEIGLAMSATGPTRIPGGNVYSSQFATNWTGTVSTGKNLCHADCDGNGVIDLNDTLAIFNNFLIPHAFKSTSSASNNLDVYIKANPIANAGLWNKATIVLGDNSNFISQISGLAFTFNYDASIIETDSVYLVYTPSFLNNNGQNVQFRKNIFNTGKLFGTSIRTDNVNVNGNGEIAEIHFKLKSGLAENSILNFSLSDVQKINSSGNLFALSPGSTTMLVDGNAVGLSKESINKQSVSLYPNPSSNEVTFLSNSTEEITYKLFTINGQELCQNKFKTSVKLDLTKFTSGTYFVEFEQNDAKAYKKLIITR